MHGYILTYSKPKEKTFELFVLNTWVFSSASAVPQLVEVVVMLLLFIMMIMLVKSVIVTIIPVSVHVLYN